MSVIFFFVQKLSLKSKALKYVSVIILDWVLFAVLKVLNVNTRLHIEIIPMAFFFYLLGYLLKAVLQTHISEKAMQWWFIALPVTVVCSSWNSPVTMYKNEYGNIILFLLGATAGTYMVCGLAEGLKKNSILSWIGQNSIIIYVLHFKLINALHFVGKTIFPQLSEINYCYPANWHYFLIAVFLLLPATYICSKWFGPLFGKNR